MSMRKNNSEACKAVSENAAKMLRDLADIVERGDYYDIQFNGLGQYYTLLGEPVRRQYNFMIVTEEGICD